MKKPASKDTKKKDPLSVKDLPSKGRAAARVKGGAVGNLTCVSCVGAKSVTSASENLLTLYCR